MVSSTEEIGQRLITRYKGVHTITKEEREDLGQAVDMGIDYAAGLLSVVVSGATEWMLTTIGQSASNSNQRRIRLTVPESVATCKSERSNSS